MKTVIVIQARLGSSRLPCKALLCLHKLPVIDWVTRRCHSSRLSDDLVVAIPDTPHDDVLAHHVETCGIKIWRGSEQDVLSRILDAAHAFEADAVVRVCADNPLVCGEEIDNLISFYKKHSCNYAYNHIPRRNLYPDGLGAEIVSLQILEHLNKIASLPAHREHCFSYITDNPTDFVIQTFDPPDPCLHHPELKLDLDTMEDFVHLSLLPIYPEMTSREIVHACGVPQCR